MSDYFDYSTGRLTPGAVARSSEINTTFDALDTGLALLPTPDHLKRGKMNYAVATGTANAILVSLTYAPLAYEDGMEVVFKAAFSNTAAATINVNSLGIKSIRRQDGTALVAGDITNAKIHTLRYNTTSEFFEIQGSPVGAGGAGTMAAQNASAVEITGGTINGITAETDAGSVVTIDGTQTLTNKTLTSPVINTPTGDVATLTGTQTLTNKTLTSPKINEDVALTATATKLNDLSASTATGAEITTAASGIGVTIPRVKFVEIGDWDMDASATVAVAHGLTFAKIISANALIINDLGSYKYNLTTVDNGLVGGWIRIDDTNITLGRTNAGFFDHTNFDSTSYNRGHVVLTYLT
jgi:hypothetical protein